MSVVVTGDGPSTDVGSGSHCDVTKVSKVRSFGSLAKRRVLGLDEGPCLGSVLEHRSGTKRGIRAHFTVFAYLC